jgi:hypothetical protein
MPRREGCDDSCACGGGFSRAKVKKHFGSTYARKIEAKKITTNN